MQMLLQDSELTDHDSGGCRTLGIIICEGRAHVWSILLRDAPFNTTLNGLDGPDLLLRANPN